MNLRRREEAMKYNIGDIVADEDGCSGTVVIQWDDGDICETEETAAHLNPMIVGSSNRIDQKEGEHETS